MGLDTVKVRIGTIYLTDTGLADGSPCKVEADGLNALQFNKLITSTQAANGGSNLQGVEVGDGGVKITLTLIGISRSLLDSIIALFNAALAAGTSVEAEFIKDFAKTVNVLPAFENRTYYTEKRFRKRGTNDFMLYEVRLTLQTVS